MAVTGVWTKHKFFQIIIKTSIHNLLKVTTWKDLVQKKVSILKFIFDNSFSRYELLRDELQ